MGISRTSFAPGNLAAVTHGARSPRVRERMRKELAVSIREHIQQLLPDLMAPDSLLLDLLVDTLTDVRQLRDYINAQGGPVSPRGQLYKPLEMLRSRERDSLALLDRLGVGPKARTMVMSGAVSGNKSFAAQLARRRAELTLVAPQS